MSGRRRFGEKIEAFRFVVETLAELANGKYLIRDFTGGPIRESHYGEDDGEKGAPLSADIPYGIR